MYPFNGLFGNTPELWLIEFIAPRTGIIYTEEELILAMGVTPERGGAIIANAVSWGLLTVVESNKKKYRIKEPGQSPILDILEQLKTSLHNGSTTHNVSRGSFTSKGLK